MTTVARPVNAGTFLRARARRARILMVLALAAACAVGAVAGRLASAGHPTLIVGLGALVVPLIIWRWPQCAVFMLLGVATLIEQFAYNAGSRPGVFTSRIPLFGSVIKGTGTSLVELLVALILAIWVMKGALAHRWDPPRSPVARLLLVFLGLVVVAIAVGLARGGQLQVILYEVRPWAYLAVSYLVAASLLRTRRALRAVMWVLVLGTGFKAVQGVMMYIKVRHDSPPVEAILAHEESVFFGLFLILALGLWLFDVPGRLRTVATMLAPLVLIADMANARRTAWAIIGTMLLMLFGLAYSSLPERRPSLRRGAIVAMAISAVYFPVFWNNSGLVGQPARALHSQVAPDARDLSSDLYRDQENANLFYNIRKTSSLGFGFGPLIDYALPITDISGLDPFIAFLPHNSVLDMWMRMGIQGVVVFLLFLAAVVVRATALTRTGDKELAVLGVLTVCAVVAYVVQGASDLGFFWFRVAICMGTLFGAVEAGHRIAAQPDADDPLPLQDAERRPKPSPTRVPVG